EKGGSDTQVVKVDVVGTDDFPVVTGPILPPLFLNEDGAQTQVFGVQSAFDIDHGAQLHWSVGGFNFNGLVSSGYQSSYRFTVDNLKVTRNETTLFEDSFDPSTLPTGGIGYT